MGWVGLVLVGYLAALGATGPGHGWALLPHLALDHGAAPPAAPTLVSDDAPELPALTTLRPRGTHYHGAHAHSHGPDVVSEAVRQGLPLTRAHVEPDEAMHAHDGVMHRHDAPPPEPTVVPPLTLDKHRMPDAPSLPALASSVVVHRDVAEESLSVDLSVETPPPIRRG